MLFLPIDDRAAHEVLKRCAEAVDETREREEERDRHPREHMDAEHERHVLHVVDLGAERENRAEPRRDGLAVVKTALHGVQRRGRAARENRKEEEQIEPLVHCRRIDCHAILAKAADQQEDEAPEEEHACGRTAAERDHVVEVLVNARRLGHELRDEHADDVPAERHDETEVKHRACDLQVALGKELTGLRRPVPLKDGVAHDRPHDEECERDVGQDAPCELFHYAVLPSRPAASVSTTSRRNA